MIFMPSLSGPTASIVPPRHLASGMAASPTSISPTRSRSPPGLPAPVRRGSPAASSRLPRPRSPDQAGLAGRAFTASVRATRALPRKQIEQALTAIPAGVVLSRPPPRDPRGETSMVEVAAQDRPLRPGAARPVRAIPVVTQAPPRSPSRTVLSQRPGAPDAAWRCTTCAYPTGASPWSLALRRWPACPHALGVGARFQGVTGGQPVRTWAVTYGNSSALRGGPGAASCWPDTVEVVPSIFNRVYRGLGTSAGLPAHSAPEGMKMTAHSTAWHRGISASVRAPVPHLACGTAGLGASTFRCCGAPPPSLPPRHPSCATDQHAMAGRSPRPAEGDGPAAAVPVPEVRQAVADPACQQSGLFACPQATWPCRV